MEETVAWLHQPGTGQTVPRLRNLEVLRWQDGRWSGDLPSGDPAISTEDGYLILAVLACFTRDSLVTRYAVRRVWYLHRAGRLIAFDHVECSPDPIVPMSFEWVRVPPGESEALEDAALALVHALQEEEFLLSGCPAAEYYGRGLAYVEAGRPDRAPTMLDAGDAWVTVDVKGEVVGTRTIAWCKDVAEQLRDELLERLGRPRLRAP